MTREQHTNIPPPPIFGRARHFYVELPANIVVHPPPLGDKGTFLGSAIRAIEQIAHVGRPISEGPKLSGTLWQTLRAKMMPACHIHGQCIMFATVQRQSSSAAEALNAPNS